MSIIDGYDLDEIINFIQLYEKTYMSTDHHPTAVEEAAVMNWARKLLAKFRPGQYPYYSQQS